MPTAKKRISDYLTKKLWGTEDLDSLGTMRACWIKFLRFLYVLLLELSEEQLALRAMSLVYTTLLTIVPILAVSFSVLKAFGVHTKIEIFLYYLLEPLGDKAVDLSLKIISFVENVNVSVLGSIGLAMLMYTVLSQIQKIESALNYIWEVKSTRSFEKRFSNYLSVLLVGPILIFSAIGITGSLMSTSIVQEVLSVKSLGMVIVYAGKLLSYVLVSAAFTFIYIFLPNAKVRFTAAVTGGLFAGVTWKVTGMIFTAFILSSVQYSAVYSGFSILIFSLIWLYWSWFILLVGAKVSYFQQYPSLINTRKDPLSLSNSLKEKLVLLIMFHIGFHFYHNKQPWTLDSLSKQLKLPTALVRNMLTLIEKKGLVVPSLDEPPAYLPAKDLETISTREILDVVRICEDDCPAVNESVTPPEINKIMKQIDDAIYQSVENETLKSLILQRKKANG